MRQKAASNTPRLLAIGCGIFVVCCFLCCGGFTFLGWYQSQQMEQELVDANRLWDAGSKAEAVLKYKSVLNKDVSGIPSDAEKPTIYQRIIDFDVEQGNIESAKNSISLGLDRKLDIPSKNPATLELIAKVRGERDAKQAVEQARKDAEAKKRQEDKEKAPRLSVEIVKIRIEPFRTVQGLNTSMVCVDWKNTGNRTIRGLTAKITALDSRGNVTDVFPDFELYIYAAASNDRPGILPGDTFINPNDEGRIIPPLLKDRVARVEVKIVKIEETVIE